MTAAGPGRTTCILSPSLTLWRTSGRECLLLTEGARARGSELRILLRPRALWGLLPTQLSQPSVWPASVSEDWGLAGSAGSIGAGAQAPLSLPGA